MSTTPMLADDLWHERTDNPHWSESAWFSFMAPERGINGWVHLMHRPNLGITPGGAAVWDATGEETHDCLLYEYPSFSPTPKGALPLEFELESGLQVRTIEPFKAYDVRFEGKFGHLDLQWRAINAAQSPASVGIDAMREYMGGHFQQGGRATGQLMLEGEVIPIDCHSQRDRSWGPRVGFHTAARAGYNFAYAPDNDGFVIGTYRADTQGLDPTDPVWDTTEVMRWGWYIKDGEVSPLVSGERRVTSRDSNSRPRTIVIDGGDALGRELHADGVFRSWLLWTQLPHVLVWWCQVEWEFDGKPGWGEEQESLPWQLNRRIRQKTTSRR